MAKKGKNTKQVYLLHETYKECGDETIGAYDSMQAMMRGFAARIAGEITESSGKRPKEAVGCMIANALADLIPAFFDDTYPRDDEGCISYGDSRFGYDIMPIESVEDEEEDEKSPDEDDEEET